MCFLDPMETFPHCTALPFDDELEPLRASAPRGWLTSNPGDQREASKSGLLQTVFLPLRLFF